MAQQIQPITPRIRFTNPDGSLTREGFQVLQAVRSMIEGEEGSGVAGLDALTQSATETEGLIGGLSGRVAGVSGRLSRARGNIDAGDGLLAAVMARVASLAGRIARSSTLTSRFLEAVAALSGSGVMVKTGAETAAVRSIAGTAPVTVTDGDGVAGNPTIAVSAATDAASGIVELATNAETQTGTDTVRAVTPAGLSSRAASSTATGLVELATDAETITGTDTARALTPANLAAWMANGQLKFPATVNPSSDPNTLDDYEEGTFTPTIIGTTTAGTGTYDIQSGIYTKVGRVVHYQISLRWSAHTGTGGLRIEGLPFTADSNSPGLIYYALLDYTSPPQAMVNGTTTQILVRQAASGADANDIPMDTSATFFVSGSYVAA